jgi:hypothetical protein
MNINEINPESFYSGMHEPDGYGAFDEAQLNECTEDVKQQDECPDCGKACDEHGYFTCNCYSPCCGAPIILHDICSECKEHCI